MPDEEQDFRRDQDSIAREEIEREKRERADEVNLGPEDNPLLIHRKLFKFESNPGRPKPWWWR